VAIDIGPRGPTPARAGVIQGGRPGALDGTQVALGVAGRAPGTSRHPEGQHHNQQRSFHLARKHCKTNASVRASGLYGVARYRAPALPLETGLLRALRDGCLPRERAVPGVLVDSPMIVLSRSSGDHVGSHPG
jgi:hypothetical protein